MGHIQAGTVSPTRVSFYRMAAGPVLWLVSVMHDVDIPASMMRTYISNVRLDWKNGLPDTLLGHSMMCHEEVAPGMSRNTDILLVC